MRLADLFRTVPCPFFGIYKDRFLTRSAQPVPVFDLPPCEELFLFICLIFFLLHLGSFASHPFTKPQFSQCPFMSQASISFTYLSAPPLYLFQFVHLFLVLVSPQMDIVTQMQFYKCLIKESTFSPQPAAIY